MWVTVLRFVLAVSLHARRLLLVPLLSTLNFRLIHTVLVARNDSLTGAQKGPRQRREVDLPKNPIPCERPHIPTKEKLLDLKPHSPSGLPQK